MYTSITSYLRRIAAIVATASLALPFAAFAGDVTFTADTDVVIPGSGIELTINSGSNADIVVLDTNTITITISGADTLTIEAPNENRLENDKGVNPCARVSGVVTMTVDSGDSPIVITPSATACTVSSGGSSGGGTVVTPAITVTDPNGGEALAPGSVLPITWSWQGRVDFVDVYYSANGGAGWALLANDMANTGTFNWTVPDVDTDQALVRVDGTDTVVTFTSDVSDAVFSILGTQPPPPPPPPTTDPNADPTATGRYDPAVARAATPTIDIDKGLVAVSNPACTPGSLIRASLPTVYYCGIDGRRYVFPNEKTYFTWFADFSGVIFVTDEQLAAVPLGENVTYRPGVRMIKIQSDAKVYAVSRGGLLRWVETEGAAAMLYGPNWNQFIHDVPDVFFVDYTLGASITEASLH